jgi:hypothetical protein
LGASDADNSIYRMLPGFFYNETSSYLPYSIYLIAITIVISWLTGIGPVWPVICFIQSMSDLGNKMSNQLNLLAQHRLDRTLSGGIMKRNLTYLCVLAVFFIFCFASISSATPVLKLVSDSNTITVADGSALDSDVRPDFIAFSGAIGDWNVQSLNGSSNETGFNFNATVLDGGSMDLAIWFSDDDFVKVSPITSVVTSVSGTIPYLETMKMGSFYGTEPLERNNYIHIFESSVSEFMDSSEDVVPVADTYSMTQIVRLSYWAPTGGSAYTISAGMNNAPVPEPSSMILLGSGLIGAALLGKRKK